MYPNPGTGMFFVEIKSDEVNSDVSVSDLTGKVVFSSVIGNNQASELDLQHLENGIYLLQVSTKNKNEFSKIVINK